MTLRNEQVAEMFAKGCESGMSKNMFICNDFVYSYGKHFPIAIRLKEGVYLFNFDDYSHTTSIHKKLVWNALIRRQETILIIPDCDVNKSNDMVNHNTNEIRKMKDKITRVRSENKRYEYEQEIEWLEQQNKLLSKFLPKLIAEKI